MTKTPQELAASLRRANAWWLSETDEPMPDTAEFGQVLDQVIALLEEKAQQQTIVLSDCCQAKTGIGGRNSRGSTRWYVCTDCRKPCDVYYQENPTQP